MIYAFIDESGVVKHGSQTSPYFILAAAIVRDKNLGRISLLLGEMRRAMGRQPEHYFSFKDVRSHHHRLAGCNLIRQAGWLKISSVVVAKNELDEKAGHQRKQDAEQEEDEAKLDIDVAYMYTFRLLLERLSWLGREYGEPVSYTLAQINRFPLSKLREYEGKLKTAETQIDWRYIDSRGGRINQPQRDEQLILGDWCASSIAQAFNPDKTSQLTEPHYLELIGPRLYRHGSGPKSLVSYGLKLHPCPPQPAVIYPFLQGLQR